MVHTRYDNQRASFIHSFIHRSAPQWWESMRSCPIGYDGNVLFFPMWRNGPFQEITNIPPPLAPAVLYIFPIVAKHRFSSDHTRPEWFSTPLAYHPSTGCLNTGFHRITLGQSDSAPTNAPSIHWMPELVVDDLNLSRAQPAWAGPPWPTDW